MYNIIWIKCHKQVFVERSILQLSVYSAILQFNESQFGLDKVYEKLGIQTGVCLNIISEKMNRRTVENCRATAYHKCFLLMSLLSLYFNFI